MTASDGGAHGLNFTERGFGARPALGCSDRGHTAISQLKPGVLIGKRFLVRKARAWFHTGGIFWLYRKHAAGRQGSNASGEADTERLSRMTSIIVTLCGSRIGGKARAQEVNRELAPLVDVMLGNEEDFNCLPWL